MFANYFKTAIRTLTRNKFFSAINIFGLAVAMSICMSVMMLVADQLQYDRFNSKRDRIYRINTVPADDENSVANGTSSPTLRSELLEKYTGIESAVSFKSGFGNHWLGFEHQDVNIPLAGFFADRDALKLFEYRLQYGDPDAALAEPFSVVLTRKAANKLFEVENPLGKTIKMGDLGTFTVTGVLSETENKSHIAFEALGSMASFRSLQAQGKREPDSWTDYWNGWTYVLLEEGKTASDLQAYLDEIYAEHIGAITNPEAYKMKFKVQSLTSFTPGPFTGNSIGPSLPWVFVYGLAGLALVILATSCFNFTNLSIARSLTRAQEIGIRKVSGAARSQIFVQFLSESVVTAMCALAAALMLLVAIRPIFLQLNFARTFRWDLEANSFVYGVFLVFAIFVGILAGIFPALVLSGFQPIKVLKSLNNVKLLYRVGLRKGLLVSQFALSLFFILTVIVAHRQLDLFLKKDLGFDSKNKMFISLGETSATQLKTELLKYNNISSVAAASHIPCAGTSYGDGFKKDLSEKEWTDMNFFYVDEDYANNLGLKIVAGEFLGADPERNKSLIIINEEAVRAFHFATPFDALGEEMIYRHDSTRLKIIGVVRNYNHKALMKGIDAMGLIYDPSRINLLQVSFSGTYADAGKAVEKAWATVNPLLKPDYKPLEGEIRLFYDTVFGDLVNVLGVVAGLAIMISCLGLLGMATYATETRVKEIAIRKVLGSSNKALVFLLSRGFLTMLALSIAIAVPLSWFANNFWLQLLPYRVSFDLTIIASGVSFLLFFGVLTIGSQTLRATYVNPAENLKNE